MAKTPAQHAATLDASSPAMHGAQAGSTINDVVNGYNLMQAEHAALVAKWNAANAGNTVTVTSAQVLGLGARTPTVS